VSLRRQYGISGLDQRELRIVAGAFDQVRLDGIHELSGVQSVVPGADPAMPCSAAPPRM